MLLPVAMATAYPLLHTLRIPRQVIIDDERTKLDIDPFRRRLGGDHDAGLVAEMFNQRRAYVDVSGA